MDTSETANDDYFGVEGLQYSSGVRVSTREGSMDLRVKPVGAEEPQLSFATENGVRAYL
jgi:hypothetical protein